MIFKDTLLNVLKNQDTPTAPADEVGRIVAPTLTQGMASVITGIRRCGKSTLQAQIMRQHPGSFYCNFENTRLFGMSAEDFPTWLDALALLSPTGCEVFLDEVQEVEGWQRLVRTLLDQGRTVCVTGSNASLLGRELGSKLTGRHLSFQVYPFCYSEYLAYTHQTRGVDSLSAFLDNGGFPMYLTTRNEAVLQELLRDVVQRDVVSRHKLRESSHVMNLVLFLLANTGQPFSLQKLTKNLEVPTAAQTSKYVEFLKDAYLLFSVQKYSDSFRQRVAAPMKYYCIDNGLRRANSPQTSPDVGRRLENAVALELLRRKITPYYAAEIDAWECDFVAGETVIQVCLNVNEKNYKRELRGLMAAKAQARAKEAIIITLDQSERIKGDDGEDVQLVPAWEWLG
jgi:predicted AAA+ superfamily ATPase